MTSDEATLHKLSGKLQAVGHVHLRDRLTELWSEQLDMNVNTEAGVVTQGKMVDRGTNTWVRGRLLQRFSETHVRGKDGSFTTCDADDGQIPDWSFSFQDMDMEQGDSVYARGVWLRVRDTPVLPLPTFQYPIPGNRKTGLLFPEIGTDNVLGFKYRQGFFWAISPSQDLTITPQVFSKRGAGGELEYRYILDRRSRGNWLVQSLRDTDEDQFRAQFTGAHVQQVNPDLSVRVKVNYATDRTVLSDFSTSGVFRALPSQESIFSVNQRLSHGNVFVTGQYLQPLDSGGQSTFQRVPEIGHRYISPPLWNDVLSIEMNSTVTHFWREEGFDVSRVEFAPGISTQGLHIGHVLGLRPQLKAKEVIYSHGRESSQNDVRSRGTVWAGMEASSSLVKRFTLQNGKHMRHTINPKVFYEYVPPTRQEDLSQIDAIDDLPKKSLLTYSVKSSLKETSSGGGKTWLDMFLAQSYHVGSNPGDAKTFSDVLGKAIFHLPATSLQPGSQASVAFDSFFDPNDTKFRQLNTDLRLQRGHQWYLTLGHRYTRSGVVPRRGDIWNAISMNEVLAPQDKINFLTASGGVRITKDLTVGTKVYQDFVNGVTSEWDVVGMYQNPCRCWSLGLFYSKLAGSDTSGTVEARDQFSFVLTLRGIGATPSAGTSVMQSILNPLLGNESDLPWSAN
jgi:LPS-assembly protein